MCNGRLRFTYFVGVFGILKYSGEQSQTDDFLLALVLADVTGERVVVFTIVETDREALERLIAPFVFLKG